MEQTKRENNKNKPDKKEVMGPYQELQLTTVHNNT